jgi:non-reducing end alpha-L-arabinofuranosidase
MKSKINLALMLALASTLFGATLMMAQQSGAGSNAASQRPKGPCDIYGAAGDACVAAHSTTRALYASYNGPLYQVLRQSDGKTLDIGVVGPNATDGGGYADATKQDAFCAHTHCWISIVYDQSPKHNDLTQAPRGGFSSHALGGFNNLPVADWAPVSVMGHKVYGVFIVPGMGIRNDDPKGTAVDDQAEGQYWVINGHHYNNGCCYDYGNAEIDSRDDDNGTMETTYYGNTTPWFHGPGDGPWIMTDQENNLVGCVNTDGTKGCPNIPTIEWRFVTAMAKGEPHHWTSMGGDAQGGPLKVMFDGPRVDSTYDPMRKQGAILLGNGGDNSIGSQGTFYEGAMTAAGTFPTDATDQLIHANVVAAKYAVAAVSVAPASAKDLPTGLQTFTPGSSQDTLVTFTNVSGAPAKNVQLSISVPKQWTAASEGKPLATIAGPVAPGASVNATFKVTSGPAAFNGDMVGNAKWTNATSGKVQSDMAAEKVRNVNPVKINEFRISSGSQNSTDSFIELYNAGASAVDISNWALTEHPTQQPIFSSVKIPAATKLASHGFYLLGLSNSGLTIPARAGDTTLNVRSTTGISVGDTVEIDTGANIETHKIATVGTAASAPTTLWQPLPDGLITIPVGSTNVPVTSTAGFVVGQKIALGYGASFPAVARDTEKYEVATVTEVGKPGTQSYLALDAPAGATNLQVFSTANISVGDKIRLDIDSVGHGIETVTVTKVGTEAIHTNLAVHTAAGSGNIKVRNTNGFAVGDKIIVGTPTNNQTVTIKSVGTNGPNGTGIDITPMLMNAHNGPEWVVRAGTGLDLAAPLQFTHAGNLPFAARGTGITFTPATAFPHLSNEPVQALGTGITLDSALTKDHAINSVVRDTQVKTAGYQGTPEPNQLFGGPALSSVSASTFGGPPPILNAGNMVLRDAAGMVVDSLNYGNVIDPWASEGYQAVSGTGKDGCFVGSPSASGGFGPAALAASATNKSAGRAQDGIDTDSNCTDFTMQPATTLPAGSAAGATNIKVGSVAGFTAGQAITVDSGSNVESAVIATVGTAGATTVSAATAEGATVIQVASPMGFVAGASVTIDDEAATIASVSFNRGGASITVAAPLAHAHAAGAQVSGSGITLNAALARAHAKGTQIERNAPTPGAANKYDRP